MSRAALIVAAALAAAALALAGCGETDAASSYLASRSFRRAELQRSLVDPSNGYSRLRLEQYARDDGAGPAGWDALPLWNPAVRAITRDDIGRFVDEPYARSAAEDTAFAPVVDASDVAPLDRAALVTLGRRAFESYPVQVDMDTGAQIRGAADAAKLGLWTDDRGRVGGLVRVRLPDGGEGFATTCATCHARPDSEGRLVHGASNVRFDRGLIGYRAAERRGGDLSRVAAWASWGPGRVDVTRDGVNNPTAITDLRAVRYQSHLHWAATLRNGLIPLAIRLETLVITSSGQAVRPPRLVSLALATYLWSLGQRPSGGDAPSDATRRGAAHFRARCASCHRADGSSAAPVSLATVATDDAVGRSPERGTGRYRVPSLFGVGDRPQLLHDGSVTSLEELLSPSRLPRVAGHRFGTDLAAAARRDLVSYLRTL